MSQYGPCEKCGIYTSVGPYEAIICSRCGEEDEAYRPENTLDEYIRGNDLDNSDVVGLKVRHLYHESGVIESKLGLEVEVSLDGRSRHDRLNIASDCLEIAEE